MTGPPVTKCVVVKHAQGLHARPAEVVARAAMGFQAEVTLTLEEHRVDAKSILSILTLGARQGAQVVVEARGDDADRAVERLAELLESDFNSDEGEPFTQGQAG